MTAHHQPMADADTFGWLEYLHRDFPYYKGTPSVISATQWILIVVSVVIAFAFLVIPLPYPESPYWQILPGVVFAAIPLLTLAKVAGPCWRALFKPLAIKDFGWMFAIAFLNLLITVVLGVIATQIFDTVANPRVSALGSAGSDEVIALFIAAVPQLFGEELFTILPFLAILSYCTNRLHLSRKKAVLIAWLATAVLFGLIHLPTYNWNVLQAVLLIGAARLVLSLAYIKTKNILVSTGAHIINDWSMFGLAVIAG